jgi:hypothetical protein
MRHILDLGIKNFLARRLETRGRWFCRWFRRWFRCSHQGVGGLFRSKLRACSTCSKGTFTTRKRTRTTIQILIQVPRRDVTEIWHADRLYRVCADSSICRISRAMALVALKKKIVLATGRLLVRRLLIEARCGRYLVQFDS